jgi:hypothetical protein
VIGIPRPGSQRTNRGNCAHYNYVMTRTWTVTDAAGNSAATLIQKITVQDTTPAGDLQNITVTLNKTGNLLDHGRIGEQRFDGQLRAANLTLQRDAQARSPAPTWAPTW